MSISNIKCKCPKCCEEILLGELLEENLLEQVRLEFASVNKEEMQRKIDAEKAKSLEEGKKIVADEMLEKARQKQAELDTRDAEINEIRLKQIEKDSEIKRLKDQQQSVIALKLAQEKSQWEAEAINSETALKLQIQQLKDDLRKASNRASQGSMQAQGEVSELMIEDALADLFPSDDVTEVKKGQMGADCILNVKTDNGRLVGKIIFEVKDTKSFSSGWIEKLKSDAISAGAQIPILVTRAWPSDNRKAHLRDGVWVCGFNEYQVLVRALRQSLLDVARAIASEEAREGKADLMFDFMTGQEFAHIIEKMISPIFRMHEQLQKEKRSVTRLWKEREVLIDNSISGTESLYMKIQGIAQVNLPAITGMEPLEELSMECDSIKFQGG